MEIKRIKRFAKKENMTANVFISGFVQGVGFRQFVKNTAKNRGLSGWTKNLSDGRVVARVAGNKKIIEKFVDDLWKGTFLSKVKNIEVEWEEEEAKHSDFEIHHD